MSQKEKQSHLIELCMADLLKKIGAKIPNDDLIYTYSKSYGVPFEAIKKVGSWDNHQIRR
jgi:hypothetical protein